MNAVSFHESNRSLSPPANDAGKDYPGVKDILSLDVWTDGNQCVSLWKPTIRERLSILFFGRVWLSILSGSTQPPVYVAGTNKYFRQKELSDLEL